jgi:hypothetical protein
MSVHQFWACFRENWVYKFGHMSLSKTVLEFLNNLWGLGTASRNRVVVPARQVTQTG